ncbi:MAG: hypothetical protein AAGU75_18170 [Bacillota bacterium]
MKKRLLAVLLVAMILAATVAPASAIEIQPYASVIVDGGLVHISGSTYRLWSSAFGISGEYKSTSATLYKWLNNKWTYQTTVYEDGYTDEVTAEKNVSLTAGDFMVNLTATSSNGTATRTRYYYI